MHPAATLTLAFATLAPLARAQTCTLVRASEALGGGDADGASGGSNLTPDGRFVVFTSGATNLVAGDTNGLEDVFVIDLATGALERVNVSSGGDAANGSSNTPSISADGRFVAFTSSATNLVALDANATVDVFVRDRALGQTARASEALGGGDASSFSFAAQISGDGRWVVFTSFASNLVPSDTNGVRDVFVRDLAQSVTERLSVSALGVEGDAPSGGNALQPAISFDGRFVAFASSATNLVPLDTNGFTDVFYCDRALGTLVKVTSGLAGAEADGDSSTSSMSRDGRFVAFLSDATNLVPFDTNATFDAFVWDEGSGAIERVSVGTGGIEGSLAAWSPFLSGGGRFVAFASFAPELVAADQNGVRDIFVRDRWAGTTVRASLDFASLEAQGESAWPAISADGVRVVFATAAPLEFTDQNGFSDVFVRSCSDARAYCLGDASACPCGNGGGWIEGCASSIGRGGSLRASGGASVSSDSFTLEVAGVPPGTVVRFLQGTLALPAPALLGDGLRCLGGSIGVLATRAAASGSTAFGFGIAGDPQLSVIGAVPSGGDYRHYQVWFRNAAPFCTAATHNLTHALEVFWRP